MAEERAKQLGVDLQRVQMDLVAKTSERVGRRRAAGLWIWIGGALCLACHTKRFR